MSQTKIITRLLNKYNNMMPTGAGVLFFVQMFSTLAFSVLYSTLVLYATTGLKLSDSVATEITASFVAFNYAVHVIGGSLGGRLLSYRALFCIGMVAQFIGCMLLALVKAGAFYWGLAIFLAGSGFNITCINCMLNQLFKPNDKRRETAFLWNYSGMNIGFFVGFSISGYFQLHHSYSMLFLLSSLGNLSALLITLSKWRILSDIKTSYSALQGTQKYNANVKGFVVIFILLLALRWLLGHSNLSNTLIMGTGIVTVFVIALLALRQPVKENGHKVWAYLLLASTALVFWTLYQLAPMGLTLFIARNVNLHYLGIQIAPQWVQNVNTMVIISGGPILSMLFTTLRGRGVRLTIPVQFSCALILIGIGFCLLPIGIHFANAQGYTHFNWVLFSFILQSAGELFISPVGYAMVGQLVPVNLQGIMMGTWLMLVGVGATLSGYFSSVALGNTKSLDPLITNAGFSHIFGSLGLVSIAVGTLLFVCVPLVLRLTHEKKLFAETQAVNPVGI